MTDTAVSAAEEGSAAWRRAAELQRAALLDHGDFYNLASEMASTLRALSSLASTLAPQVANYGIGRVLRDDEGIMPAARLSSAGDDLAGLRYHLARAESVADSFQSEIGHIGVTP